jgi:hypothetical protein
MDQETLVEKQIDDGAKIVRELRANAFAVTAAWWMRTSEEGLWFLYVASPEVEDAGIAAAYRKLHTIMQSLEPLWVDWFRVKLVGPENPIAKDVVATLVKYGDRFAARFGGKKLGNVTIDGAYIYPQPQAA